jgi:nucleotide-binding universal stress UspA family protein
MYKRILVPLDGSGLAENALKHVDILTSTYKVKEVIFLQVIEPAAGLIYNLEIAMQERIEKEIKDYLEGVADTFRKRGINARSVVAYGTAADRILEYAEQNDVQIIIMSTHGRSGISRFFSGSVAEKVMRHSTIPLLILPPPGVRTSK